MTLSEFPISVPVRVAAPMCFPTGYVRNAAHTRDEVIVEKKVKIKE